MSALDDAIAGLEHLSGRVDASRSAADQAADAADDALDAATAFGAGAHIATLTQVHDDLTGAAQAITGTADRTRGALARLLLLRGDPAGGGPRPSTTIGGGRGPRRQGGRRRRSNGDAAKSRPRWNRAFRTGRGPWRAWGEPSDHMATYSPKVAGYVATMAGLAGMTQSLLTGILATTGVFAMDVAATMYQQAKAARPERKNGD